VEGAGREVGVEVDVEVEENMLSAFIVGDGLDSVENDMLSGFLIGSDITSL